MSRRRAGSGRRGPAPSSPHSRPPRRLLALKREDEHGPDRQHDGVVRSRDSSSRAKETPMDPHRVLRFSVLAVAWVALACGVGAGPARADETCHSPYIAQLIQGHEDYVYVWTLGVEGLGDGSDKLVTVDAHPKSQGYGKVIASASVGSRGEAHHMGFTDDRRFIWAGGRAEAKTYVCHIASDHA